MISTVESSLRASHETKIKAIENKIADYLLECLDDEDPTRFEYKCIRCIYLTALQEKGRPCIIPSWCRREVETEIIKDWLMGLGLSVDFTYFDIANRMRSWGYEVNENDDDDYYYKCDLYWDLLASVIYERGWR